MSLTGREATQAKVDSAAAEAWSCTEAYPPTVPRSISGISIVSVNSECAESDVYGLCMSERERQTIIDWLLAGSFMAVIGMYM